MNYIHVTSKEEDPRMHKYQEMANKITRTFTRGICSLEAYNDAMDRLTDLLLLEFAEV